MMFQFAKFTLVSVVSIVPRYVLAVACLLVMPIAVQAQLIVSPKTVTLESPEASQQLLISLKQADGKTLDVTHAATYKIAHVNIAQMKGNGLVRPVTEGKTELIVQYQQQSVRVPVAVQKLKDPHPVSFRNEIIPILTKARCNSGGCHGKAEGQNGFKLSIFGFDAKADFSALRKEARGRRVSLTQPESSLLLKKAIAQLPHGGGRKVEPGSYRARRLLRWIEEGGTFDAADSETGRITRIEVEPSERILEINGSQQLRVTAIDSSGRRECVTVEAEYESNAGSIADVDHHGLVQASDIPGEAAILVRYLGHVAVCRVTLPRESIKFKRPAENNFIDKLVWNQLNKLGIQPSELADDATFLRRVHLDTIGTLPTAEEARAFLADKSPNKRSRKIDNLLDRKEYSIYWTMRWLDILKADQLKITPESTVAMQRWLRKFFQQNRPYHELAQELLTVQGNTQAEGLGGFYKALKKPDEVSRSISQLLLGVRIECAQCHHHPSERWSQSDYVGLAGFFTGTKLKRLPNGGESILSLGGKDLPHPRTQELISAHALGAEPADFSTSIDRRTQLASWMTSKDNPFFAKAIANRLWAHYMGRGLVMPIDDMRDTNPPSNEPLMQALTAHMHAVGFDLKKFTKTLLNSRTYQLSSRTNASNQDDVQNFSHALYKALPAEVLLDAVSQTTGVPEKFNGWPEGYRAIEIWDNRMPSYFFTIFGRPVRASVCECERSSEPSISQALHLLNSPEITKKIQSHRGLARKLTESKLSSQQVIAELYLTVLSRLPKPAEEKLMLTPFTEAGESSRRTAVEDVLWALLNCREFVYNH